MNDENLIPNKKRTPSELRENGKKGGKKSGETRKRQKSMKQVFNLIKNLPVQDEKLKKQLEDVGITDEELKISSALAWSAIYHAIKGNSQMMRLVFEMMGEDPNLKLKREELNLKKELANKDKIEDDNEETVQIYLPDNMRD